MMVNWLVGNLRERSALFEQVDPAFRGSLRRLLVQCERAANCGRWSIEIPAGPKPAWVKAIQLAGLRVIPGTDSTEVTWRD